MSSSNKRNCVITGASSGIGLELAKYFVDHDFNVIGLSKSGIIPIDNVVSLKVDLSSSEGQYYAISEIKSLCSTVNLLIHSAGIMISKSAISLEADSIMDTLALNVAAPIFLTSSLFRHLKRGKGTVIFMGSVAAELNVQGELVYSASKAAISKARENFAAEIGRSGIRFYEIRPSLCETPMTAHLDEKSEDYMIGKSIVNRPLVPGDIVDLISSLLAMPETSSGTIFNCGGAIK